MKTRMPWPRLHGLEDHAEEEGGDAEGHEPAREDAGGASSAASGFVGMLAKDGGAAAGQGTGKNRDAASEEEGREKYAAAGRGR